MLKILRRGGGYPSRNSKQVAAFGSRHDAHKELVLMHLDEQAFPNKGRHTTLALMHHEQGGYYQDRVFHHSSSPETVPFKSGEYIGHATDVATALKILCDGCIEPSKYKQGKCDCPAGIGGVYGFPLVSLHPDEVGKFVAGLHKNSYYAGAVVFCEIRGAVTKGKCVDMEEGFIGYKFQKDNGLLQVAAHPSCLVYP